MTTAANAPIREALAREVTLARLELAEDVFERLLVRRVVLEKGAPTCSTS